MGTSRSSSQNSTVHGKLWFLILNHERLPTTLLFGFIFALILNNTPIYWKCSDYEGFIINSVILRLFVCFCSRWTLKCQCAMLRCVTMSDLRILWYVDIKMLFARWLTSYYLYSARSSTSKAELISMIRLVIKYSLLHDCSTFVLLVVATSTPLSPGSQNYWGHQTENL